MAAVKDLATATGQQVRDRRTSAGMSQQTLASKAGVAIRTVCRVEAGEDTTVGTLSALADALGTTVADLLAPAPEPASGVAK